MSDEDVFDVEGIMVYLASDESSYATGALFRIDGGMTTFLRHFRSPSASTS